MFPEDRVLVGVVNRWRDWRHVQAEAWYRIPYLRMPAGIGTEYLAFFLSGGAAKEHSASGIYQYAPVRGVELRYRRDLLPEEADHPRAGEMYYKLQLGALMVKSPPILNPDGWRIHFIHSTWERFCAAHNIAELYLSRKTK